MYLFVKITILLIFVCSAFFTNGQELFGEEIKNRLDIAKTVMARLEEKATEQKAIIEKAAKEKATVEKVSVEKVTVEMATVEMTAKEKTIEEKTISVASIDLEMKKVNSLYIKWKEDPNDSSWRAFMSEITSVSKRIGAGSCVTIKTFKDNRPQEGATIKYRLTDREQIITCKSPTPTTEHFLAIGLYHIWSERKGIETSNKKSEYLITKPNWEVIIDENK